MGTTACRARERTWRMFAPLAAAMMGVVGDGHAQAPPIPTDVPVWLVGHPELDGTRLEPFENVRFSLGRIAKTGPLGVGERIDEIAVQTMTLRAERRDGRDVWVRTALTYRAGSAEPVARAEIVMDRRTLAPVHATVERQGSETVTAYDWDAHRVRVGDAEVDFDLQVLEAGAHETWMAATPWRVGMRVMLPTVLGGQSKWWAVPRVVGTEPVDLGDGVRRDAWVVEMDWWGMGKDQSTFTPGGGVDGTAGTGGMYWVLVDPVEGLPRVVRVRTEIDAEFDSVIQIQRHP